MSVALYTHWEERGRYEVSIGVGVGALRVPGAAVAALGKVSLGLEAPKLSISESTHTEAVGVFIDIEVAVVVHVVATMVSVSKIIESATTVKTVAKATMESFPIKAIKATFPIKAIKAIKATMAPFPIKAIETAETAETPVCPHEVLVQVLVVVNVLVDVLVVVIVEGAAQPSSKGSLALLEEAAVFESNIVIHIEVCVVVDPEVESLEPAAAVAFAVAVPVTTVVPPATMLMSMAKEPAPPRSEKAPANEISRQVLVGVLVLVDVLIVIIVESSTGETTVATTEVRAALNHITVVAVVAATSTAVAAGLLILVLVEVVVVIDVLVDVVVVILLAQSVEFLTDGIPQATLTTSPQSRGWLFDDGKALARWRALEKTALAGGQGAEDQAIAARGVGDALNIGKVGKIVGALGLGNKLLHGSVDCRDAHNLLLKEN